MRPVLPAAQERTGEFTMQLQACIIEKNKVMKNLGHFLSLSQCFYGELLF